MFPFFIGPEEHPLCVIPTEPTRPIHDFMVAVVHSSTAPFHSSPSKLSKFILFP